jgi:hypothetical protein
MDNRKYILIDGRGRCAPGILDAPQLEMRCADCQPARWLNALSGIRWSMPSLLNWPAGPFTAAAARRGSSDGALTRSSSETEIG